MQIKFMYDVNNIVSSDFKQGSLDFIYNEGNKTYTKRFFGQVPISTSGTLTTFLETYSANLFTIEIYNNDNIKINEMLNGRLFSISSDVVNDFCRIEIKEEKVIV